MKKIILFIASEFEVRSHGDWNAWPLSGEQAKQAALSAVVSYWVCATRRNGVWPATPLTGTIDDLTLQHPVVPNLPPLLQQQLRAYQAHGVREFINDCFVTTIQILLSILHFLSICSWNSFPLFFFTNQTGAGVVGDLLLPFKSEKSKALDGHSVLISGMMKSVTNDEFNLYVAAHGALVCGTMMKDLTTLIVSDQGEVTQQDKAAAAEKCIPIVDMSYVFDLVRNHM